MGRGRLLYAVVVVLGLLVAVVGVLRQVEARTAGPTDPTAPAAAAPIALAPTPLTVSLSRLGETDVAALGATPLLTVDAAGPVITAVRVFDGASLVGVRTFQPPARGRVSVQVAWPALREGPHVLHAEAVGEQPGEVGRSAPVRLQVVPGAVDLATVPLPGNGRSPREIARASGLAVADLVFSGPDGEPRPVPPRGRPLPADVLASGPLAAVAPTPEPATIAGREAPVASLDGCRAGVEGPPGTVVYEMTGGGLGFVARGASPYRSGELTPGPHVFVTGTDGGPADSAPVELEVPEDCLEGAWDGDTSLLDGVLTLPEPASRVWIYLGVDGGPFERYPAEGGVSGAFGVADLADVLPPLTGRTVRMEVWGADASPSAPASRLASASMTVSDPAAVAELIGGAAAVTLRAARGGDTVEMAATDTGVAFDWSTEDLRTEGVVWQVLGRPLPAGDRNTAPPVLLATGYSVHGDGGGVVLRGRAGRFTVPAGLLLGARPPAEDGALSLAAVPTPTVRELVAPGSSFGTTPLNASSGPLAGSLTTLPAGVVPVPIGDVHVRVLPMIGEAVVGDASTTVAVTLPPLPDGTAAFTSTSVSVDPGHAANPALGTCVRVTGSPATVGGGSVYRAGDGTYCPGDFENKGGGCEGWCRLVADAGSLVEVVTRVWDYLAAAYNTVVETVVAAIARFNPLCLTASVVAAVADSRYAADGCESVATVVASVAVTAVLGSVGLPARLPSSGELADIAGGDLTALAVAYLEQLGVPCSSMQVAPAAVAAAGSGGLTVPEQARTPEGGVDLCAAMVGEAVEAIRGQAEQSVAAEAASASGLPVPLPPQRFEPEPRGRYQGATVRVVADPIDPATPTTARCPLTARGDLRAWDVGGLEGTRVRRIGAGGGFVAFDPLSRFGLRPAWSATLRLAPVDVLYDTDEIGVVLTSSCFAPGSLPPIPRTPLLPPLGRWSPGEAD